MSDNNFYNNLETKVDETVTIYFHQKYNKKSWNLIIEEIIIPELREYCSKRKE